MTSPSIPPFLLIRVQDALHGAELREDGLYLPYRREGVHGEHRNTSHWAVNALVADHAYGSFSQTADGTLKGAVVIVADPRDLPTPAGLGQVDTWFRMDAVEQPDGSLARGLSVGSRAVVIAPEGMEVPDGITVRRYDGTIGQRDAMVADVAREQGVTLQQAGMWGWVGSGSPSSSDWAHSMAVQQYPEAVAAGTIHLGAHTGSLDDSLESGARLNGLLERYTTERLFERWDGVEVPMADEIRRVGAEQWALLTGMLEDLPADERARIGAFYDARLQALDRMEVRTQALDTVWQQRREAAMGHGAGPMMAAPAPLPGGVFPPPLPGASTSPPLPPPLPNGSARPPPLPGGSGWRPKGLNPTVVNAWCEQRAVVAPPPLPSDGTTPRAASRRFGG